MFSKKQYTKENKQKQIATIKVLWPNGSKYFNSFSSLSITFLGHEILMLDIINKAILKPIAFNELIFKAKFTFTS